MFVFFFFSTTVIEEEVPTETPSGIPFGEMTEAPRPPSGLEEFPTFLPAKTFLPTDSGGIVAPGVTPTPTFSGMTTPPTFSPTVDIGPVVVTDLLRFGLLFDTDRQDVPNDANYAEAALTVFNFLNEFLTTTYAMDTVNTYVGSTFETGQVAFSLNSGVFMDIGGNYTFLEAGLVPSQSNIDMRIDEALRGDSLQVLLDMLANLAGNPFSTTTDIIKTESSTMPANVPANPRMDDVSFKNITYTAALVTMIGMIFYGSMSVYKGYKKKKGIQSQPLKGAYFGGDDIVMGDPYERYGGNPYDRYQGILVRT